MLDLLSLENLVGFSQTAYEVYEKEGSVEVRIVVISGLLSSQIALIFSTQDGTATSECFIIFQV